MKLKLLGKSGMRVSELCLGTMTFGEDWGWGAGKEESRKIFDYFVSQGGNYIDTANNYTNGTSEKFVGEFIASDRDYFVLATKFTLNENPNDPNRGGNHRKNMFRSVEGSLKRLNTDYIDLFWLHAWDFTTPIEEVMRALDDLVRSGKIRHIGISDTPAWVVSRANTMAEFRGWAQFVAYQIQYSLIERNVEREILPLSEALGMAVTPWGILGSGLLTGKFNKSAGNDKRSGSRIDVTGRTYLLSEKNLAIADEVERLARETGKSATQIALNWVRQQSDNIIPIIGVRTLDQARDNIGAVDFKLSLEQLERLNKASQITLGFPYEFISSEFVRELIFGKTFNRLER
ncbi:Aryl-alcohol dehydrogenase (NADP(+)) [Candidatus Zixiibacteriota bacterium]|nr:Aryl-alcohol dehydrogenase (NADP(+)) [candidate division Zixibacteria bacterium]